MVLLLTNSVILSVVSPCFPGGWCAVSLSFNILMYGQSASSPWMPVSLHRHTRFLIFSEGHTWWLVVFNWILYYFVDDVHVARCWISNTKLNVSFAGFDFCVLWSWDEVCKYGKKTTWLRRMSWNIELLLFSKFQESSGYEIIFSILACLSYMKKATCYAKSIVRTISFM